MYVNLRDVIYNNSEIENRQKYKKGGKGLHNLAESKMGVWCIVTKERSIELEQRIRFLANIYPSRFHEINAKVSI